MDRRRIAPKPDLPISKAWGSPIKTPQPLPPGTSHDKSSYAKCECCPYGYHIDVDFVRYCEALANEKYVRKLKQLHHDRRRQRKSMEILLGQRYSPVVSHHVSSEKEENGLGRQPPDVVAAGDPLANAMEDFEETYRVSTIDRKAKRHIYPVDLLSNTVSGLSVSMSSSSDSDTCLLLNGDDAEMLGRCRSDSIDSLSTISTCTDHHHQLYTLPPSSHMANTLANFDSNASDPLSAAGQVSPSALQSIREQMAISLQRMKELEEQAKAVPVLQVKLSVLKEEKRLLMLQLKAKEETPLKAPKIVRSTGVNCSVLMRDVSVNHTTVATTSVALDARPIPTCGKCEEVEVNKRNRNLSITFVGSENFHGYPCPSCEERDAKLFKSTASVTEDNHVSRGTLTEPRVKMANFGVQAVPQLENQQSQTSPKKLETRDGSVETDKPTLRHVGCYYRPETIDRGVGERVFVEQKSQVRAIGVGSGRIDAKLLCDSCAYRKQRTIATDTNNLVERRHVGCEIDLKMEETSTDVCSKCHRILEEISHKETVAYESKDEMVEDVSSSSGDTSDDDETSSPDEASYDGVRGTIVHSCGDDEAIREGRPGAVMFLPQPKLELSETTKKLFKGLNEYLEKTEYLPSENTNADMKLVKEEWFKVSSQKDSQGLLVEEWLDALEAVSPQLLEAVVNLFDASGNTALHYAISHSNFDVVSLLLDSKVCNINHTNKAGYNCIMLSSLVIARENSHLSVLKQLFKLGDVNAKAAEHGQTALMLAASHGKADMVRVLHDAGADINIQDKDGSTALMCASEHGHLAVVRYLLAQPECEPNLLDNDNCNALSIAVEAGHKDVGLLIYAHTSLSRGSSPCSSIRSKKAPSTSSRKSASSASPSPQYSPAKSRKSTSSIQ